MLHQPSWNGCCGLTLPNIANRWPSRCRCHRGSSPRLFAPARPAFPSALLFAAGRHALAPASNAMPELYHCIQCFYTSFSQAVTCASISRDSELLATGSRDGKVKVWRLGSGECIRRLPSAHAEGGVACLAYSADTTLASVTGSSGADAAGSQLLSGGLDGVAR